MALAIFLGTRIEHVHFNLWLLGALFGAALLCELIRVARHANLSALDGSPIASLWVTTRFLIVPALFFVAIAWLVSWALGLAAAAPLLRALKLLAIYGAVAIVATSCLADLAAAIKGPRRDSPSDS
jgi:hypothetical protein